MVLVLAVLLLLMLLSAVLMLAPFPGPLLCAAVVVSAAVGYLLVVSMRVSTVLARMVAWIEWLGYCQFAHAPRSITAASATQWS
jgi:hypothetical protein